MADRAHSADARRASSGNPDDYSTPSRRALLGAIVTAPIVAGSLATAANAGARDGADAMNMYSTIVPAQRGAMRSAADSRTWEVALKAYRDAEQASDAHYEIVECGMYEQPDAYTSSERAAIIEESNRLSDAILDVENHLFEVPAPNLDALATKLDLLFVGGNRDPIPGFQVLVLADARRLASADG